MKKSDTSYPLRNLRVLITRDSAGSRDLASLLRTEKAEPIEVPLIEIIPPKEWKEIDEFISKLNRYDVVVFTSSNAVRIFCGRVKEIQQMKSMSGRKIAVIGKSTAEELGRFGLAPHIIPKTEGAAEELFDELKSNLSLKKCRVLFPRAQKAREWLADSLTNTGAHVDVLTVYETKPSSSGQKKLQEIVASEKVDWVLFTSSSAVRVFSQSLSPKRAMQFIMDKNVNVGSIGRSTSSTLEEIGIPVTVQPSAPSLEGIIEEMKRVEEENSNARR